MIFGQTWKTFSLIFLWLFNVTTQIGPHVCSEQNVWCFHLRDWTLGAHPRTQRVLRWFVTCEVFSEWERVLKKCYKRKNMGVLLDIYQNNEVILHLNTRLKNKLGNSTCFISVTSVGVGCSSLSLCVYATGYQIWAMQPSYHIACLQAVCGFTQTFS